MHSLEVKDKSKNFWCKHQIFVFVKRWMLSVLVKNVSGSLEKFGKKLQQEHPEKEQFGDRTNWEIFISHLAINKTISWCGGDSSISVSIINYVVFSDDL